MGIAPIDLQTLFTQLDKVGKTHTSQREGQAIQQAVQSIQHQRKIEEQISQINEAQDTGEGANKINDQGHHREHGENKKKERENKEEDESGASVLRDPSLGKNIDISL